MTMAKLGFGELELSILKIVRECGRVTVREVYEKLGSAGGYTTIMTVMSRMADKGELMREKEGKQYTYWIASQNESPSKNILKRIQDKIFAGKSTAMVSYLLDADSEISDQDLEEIEKLIQKRRSEKKHG
jgi:predicted transcriptional regulator